MDYKLGYRPERVVAIPATDKCGHPDGSVCMAFAYKSWVSAKMLKIICEKVHLGTSPKFLFRFLFNKIKDEKGTIWMRNNLKMYNLDIHEDCSVSLLVEKDERNKNNGNKFH